jgi:hypothetical protein
MAYRHSPSSIILGFPWWFRASIASCVGSILIGSQSIVGIYALSISLETGAPDVSQSIAEQIEQKPYIIKTFLVTAYYSPTPGQNTYARGSYDADTKLNGKGIAGSSGKEVFYGMLAAPKSYGFGTQIYLEGLGIGSVEDR